MSKTALQSAFRVGLALLLLIGAVEAAPAASQTGQAAAQPPADRSKTWG